MQFWGIKLRRPSSRSVTIVSLQITILWAVMAAIYKLIGARYSGPEAIGEWTALMWCAMAHLSGIRVFDGRKSMAIVMFGYFFFKVLVSGLVAMIT